MICYNYLTKFFCGSKEVILESEKVYDSTLEENSSINSGDFDDIMRSRVYHRKMSKANNRLIKGIYTKRRNIFFADSRNFRHICEIQRRFENGELGVGPTDTIYCLMCKATNDLMIQRMYAVKNRPNFKPVSFWIPNLEKLSEKDFNPVLWEFMKNLFPTQVSIVLPKGKWLDKILPSWQTSAIGNEDSIAIRCPNSPLILGLMEKVGPLAITSANPSGDIDVTDWMKTINKMKQMLGKQECNSGAVSGSDGWCKNDNSVDSKEHQTDFELAEYLSQFLKGKHVGSFGDGPGRYKKFIDDTKLLKVYDAYDGSPFAEVSSEGSVKFLDFSITQYGLPIYDWVISIEAAEHIPRKYEGIFFSNLVRHARTGIILSWATPEQVGRFHVNNRPLQYVTDVMKKLRFDQDKAGSLLLQSHASFIWLKNNTHIYYRQNNSHIDINYA